MDKATASAAASVKTSDYCEGREFGLAVVALFFVLFFLLPNSPTPSPPQHLVLHEGGGGEGPK